MYLAHVPSSRLVIQIFLLTISQKEVMLNIIKKSNIFRRGKGSRNLTGIKFEGLRKVQN